MKIVEGLPTETGNYACYLTNHDVSTVVRFWLVGTGWIANLHEPAASRSMHVTGIVGPLPTRGEKEVSTRKAWIDATLAQVDEAIASPKTALEFDL